MSQESVNMNSASSVQSFLKQLSLESNLFVKTEKLHSFVTSHLSSPNDMMPSWSSQIFLNVVAKIPDLFSDLLECNETTTSMHNKESKTLKLQNSLLCLDTLIFFLKLKKSTEELILLLQTSLKVLHMGYSHCKDSEIIYGDLFDEFTNQLALFFQKIQEAQVLFILDLDCLMSESLEPSSSPAIISFANDFGKLCELVIDLDVIVATKLWRAFVKMILHFSDIVTDELNMGSVLNTLVTSISDIICECKEKLNANEKVEPSDVKVFVFQLNIVMKLFNVFKGRLNASLSKIKLMVLDLYSLLILCYSSLWNPEWNVELIQTALSNCLSIMVSLFHSDKLFSTLAIKLAHKEVPSHLHLPHILLKITALNHVHSENDNSVAEQKVETLKKVLLTFKENTPEDDLLFTSLKLPSRMFSSANKAVFQHQTVCTIYQVAYCNLREFAKKIPDSHFLKLDSFFIDLFLTSSNVLPLLVSDVWMFRLRCSSVQQLAVCCYSVAEVVTLKSSCVILREHLKRMLTFLPAKEKQVFAERYPDIANNFNHRNAVRHQYGIPRGISKQGNVTNLQQDEVIRICRPLLQQVHALLNGRNQATQIEEITLVKNACSILELFTLCISVLSNAEVLQCCELSKLLFPSGVYEVQAAILTFLRALGGKQLAQDASLNGVMGSVASLMADCLNNRNYALRLVALDTYATFSRSTPHPDIVRRTVSQNPHLLPQVQAFFKKAPPYGTISEEERMKCLEKQLQQPLFEIEPSYSAESKKALSCLLPSWFKTP